MFPAQATQLTVQALWLVLSLSGPPIAAAAIVGLLVAIFQSATQLQEQTVQYAAKLIAIALTLLVTGSLLAGAIYRFAERVFTVFPTLGHS